MKAEGDTQKTETIAKVEWSEPKVSWVKPELVRIEGFMNIEGKVNNPFEPNGDYGVS